MHVGILCEHSDPRRGGAERTGSRAEGGHRPSARTGPHAVVARPAALRPWHYARAFLPELRKADVILSTVPVPGCDFYQPHTGILGASVPAHLDPLPAPLRFARRWNPYRVAHFAALRAFEARAVAPPARASPSRLGRGRSGASIRAQRSSAGRASISSGSGKWTKPRQQRLRGDASG
jgi:hypothetical protein